MQVDRRIKAAAAYLERGWQLFTVSESKRPWHNCSACPTGAHDGEQCPCLFCHSFQAASGDAQKIEQMLSTRPEGLLAVRTGLASGIFVIDAEGTDRVKCGRTGLDVIEDYDWWGSTLKAETSGGGLHLYYAMPAGEGVVGMSSRNRVLHNVDIKADGGYVVCPPAAGRRWLNWVQKDGVPEVPSGALLDWSRTVKGGSSGTGGAGGGTTLKDRLVDGRVPAGERYEFLRDLVYKLRKRGVSRHDAEEACAGWYERFDQPPVAETELPWRQVEYELERVWARVEPERPDPRQMKWARRLGSGASGGSSHAG